jgi:hypothetical protein
MQYGLAKIDAEFRELLHEGHEWFVIDAVDTAYEF